MKQHFIVYDTERHVLTFVNTDRPMKPAEVRTLVRGEKTSPRIVQVRPVNKSLYEYIMSVVLDDDSSAQENTDYMI